MFQSHNFSVITDMTTMTCEITDRFETALYNGSTVVTKKMYMEKAKFDQKEVLILNQV